MTWVSSFVCVARVTISCQTHVKNHYEPIGQIKSHPSVKQSHQSHQKRLASDTIRELNDQQQQFLNLGIFTIIQNLLKAMTKQQKQHATWHFFDSIWPQAHTVVVATGGLHQCP